MHYNQSASRWLIATFVGAVLAITAPARAGTSYTWTNELAGNLFDYWTNSANWSPATSSPGAASGDSAFLTNQISLAYTNRLDSTPANSLTALAISNAAGEAWLVVTNGASSPTTLNTAVLTLGSGGRLAIANGGVVNVSCRVRTGWAPTARSI